MNIDPEDLLFEVATPLGFRVRVTKAYWTVLVQIKHPAMAGREADVQATLADPDEIRRSRTDPAVHLFYKSHGSRRWVCAVCKSAAAAGF